MKTKPVLQVLGGGRLQKKIIRQAEDNGISVAVTDRDPGAPGKALGTYKFDISANDLDGNLQIARDLKIDGIVTLGTDQPVVVAAHIARELNLPFFVSPETALLSTNKESMKLTLAANNIPNTRYTIIGNSDSEEEITEKIKTLTFPVVIKPVDSQGQRGIAVVNDERQLLKHVPNALVYSRAGRLIVEDYVEGHEVTANTWIHNGDAYILALTDRVTYFQPPSIGICLAHIFPSMFGEKYLNEIRIILGQIAAAFGIKEGPLYVQMLLTEQGPLVVELACRIGGGHEEDLIPVVSGLDVRQCLIDFALSRNYKFNAYDFNYSIVKDHCAVFFLSAKGNDEVVESMSLENQISDKDILWGEFYIKKGGVVHNLSNATDRIGAFLIKGNGRNSLLGKVRKIYETLRLRGKNYENIVENIFTLPLKNL
jgi:biotin carboxylase